MLAVHTNWGGLVTAGDLTRRRQEEKVQPPPSIQSPPDPGGSPDPTHFSDEAMGPGRRLGAAYPDSWARGLRLTLWGGRTGGQGRPACMGTLQAH